MHKSTGRILCRVTEKRRGERTGQVPVFVFNYDESGNLGAEVTKEKLLSEQSYTYAFEKAPDGHFILLSIAKD